METFRRIWTRWGRLGFAALALVAIAMQFPRSAAAQGGALNVLSFFTYQANLYAAAVLIWLALTPPSWAPNSKRDLVRGAAVVYLAITGIVYAVLLAGKPSNASIPWVNSTLHIVMPLVLLADWLIEPPNVGVTYRRAIWWLTYPLAWVAFSLLRGGLTGWYPYPFLNPTLPGNSWWTVLLFVAGILAAFLLVSMVVVWIGSLVRRWLHAPIVHGPRPAAMEW